jgi:Spy/CpxP family protein refolding chaperone
MNAAWMRTGLAAVVFACALAASGCGGGSTPAAASAADATGQVAAGGDDEAHHHRHHHHGGMAMLIGLSLKDLTDLTADQKTAIEKIKTDLHAKMEPVHQANVSLENMLADGVAAGAVDRGKADAAVAQIATAIGTLHDATADSINQLHAVLTPPQRAALIDKIQAHWQKWKDAHGRDEEGTDPKPKEGGPLAHIQKDLSLSDDQVAKIKASFADGVKAAGQTHDHKEVEGHMQAFGTAFKADTFDAKSLTTENDANKHIAAWGATRMARFFEAAAPVLTPDQRTQLAAKIRDRASKPPV